MDARPSTSAALLLAVFLAAPAGAAADAEASAARARITRSFLSGDAGPDPAGLSGEEARLARELARLRGGVDRGSVLAFARLLDEAVPPLPEERVMAFYVREPGSAAPAGFRPSALTSAQKEAVYRSALLKAGLLGETAGPGDLPGPGARPAGGRRLPSALLTAAPRPLSDVGLDAPPAPFGELRPAGPFASPERGAVVPAVNGYARTRLEYIADGMRARAEAADRAFAAGDPLTGVAWRYSEWAGHVVGLPWSVAASLTGKDAGKEAVGFTRVGGLVVGSHDHVVSMRALSDSPWYVAWPASLASASLVGVNLFGGSKAAAGLRGDVVKLAKDAAARDARAAFRADNAELIARNLAVPDDAARRAAVREQMPDLSPAQAEAVLSAHHARPCAGDDCTFSDLRVKYELMTGAGMTPAQVREALDRGLAGFKFGDLFVRPGKPLAPDELAAARRQVWSLLDSGNRDARERLRGYAQHIAIRVGEGPGARDRFVAVLQKELHDSLLPDSGKLPTIGTLDTAGFYAQLKKGAFIDNGAGDDHGSVSHLFQMAYLSSQMGKNAFARFFGEVSREYDATVAALVAKGLPRDQAVKTAAGKAKGMLWETTFDAGPREGGYRSPEAVTQMLCHFLGSLPECARTLRTRT